MRTVPKNSKIKVLNQLRTSNKNNMATLRLPVQNGTDAYRVQVELDGIFYGLKFRWNARDNHWYMDIDQALTPILEGMKVVNGLDLLAQFGHMKVDDRIPPGTFEVFDTDPSINRDPDTDTFGDTVLLLYQEAS